MKCIDATKNPVETTVTISTDPKCPGGCGRTVLEAGQGCAQFEHNVASATQITATISAAEIRPGDTVPDACVAKTLKVSTFFAEGAFVPHRMTDGGPLRLQGGARASDRAVVTPEFNEAIRALLSSTCDVLVACEYLSAASHVRIALENAIPRPSINRRLNKAELLAALQGLLDVAREIAERS